MSQSSEDDHTEDINFEQLEHYLEEGDKVTRQCAGKDVIILLGGTGSGKSVLFNYLKCVPLRKVSPATLGIQSSLEDFVVDTADVDLLDIPIGDVATIGHNHEAMTLIPQVSNLVSDDDSVLLCDSPGFLDNRSMEIHIANAVNIRNILFAARGVKIILVVECSSLTTGRQGLVDTVAKIACNLFGTADKLCYHAASILLCISKVPESQTPTPLDVIKENLRTNRKQFSRPLTVLSHNVFTCNPLNTGTLRYEPASTREELVARLREIPAIRDPRSKFCTSLSSDDIRAIEEICRHWNCKIQEYLNKPDMLTASKYFQKLKSLNVLDHPVGERALNDTRKTIMDLHTTIVQKADLSMAEGKLEVTRDKLVDLAKLLKTFEFVDYEDQLQQLERKYKDKMWWRAVKVGAIKAGAATAVIVAGTAAAVVSPAIPICAARGIALACVTGGAEVGVVANRTKQEVDKVNHFSAKQAASTESPAPDNNSDSTTTPPTTADDGNSPHSGNAEGGWIPTWSNLFKRIPFRQNRSDKTT